MTALQIVEQIFPFFTPQYTVTVKPFSNIPDLTEDVPITLSSTNFSDDFEGAIEQRRTIVYTLSFEMKINFYGNLINLKLFVKLVIIYSSWIVQTIVVIILKQYK